MKYLFSRFFIGLCLFWNFCFPGFCEKIPGTLSQLSLFHTHLQWELFVDQKDLLKVCGIQDVNIAMAKQEQISSYLNNHIRLQTDTSPLKGNLVKIRKQAPSYWVLTLNYPFQNEPKTIEVEYDFANTFDGSDRTTLVFYDRRGEKKDSWITILHDSRKMMRWTPQGLENVFLRDTLPEFPSAWVIILLAALWLYPFRWSIWQGNV